MPVWRTIFESRGYREVLPSGIEFLDIYTRGNQVISERAYKFLDREDRLLALRADFTPAVARMMASRVAPGAEPMRLWYSGNVFRRVEPRKGGYAEFWQVGAELIGGSTVAHDCEMIDLALENLDAAGMTTASVHINHAGIFRGILNAAKLPETARERLASEIDHKDARALAAHLEEIGVPAAIGEQVHVLARCIGGPEVLDEAAAVLVDGESRAAIDASAAACRRICSRVQTRLVFDLTEIDEMEYYTGVMFTLLSPARQESARVRVAGTTRLLRAFGNDLPAVGFSLSMDSVLEGR